MFTEFLIRKFIPNHEDKTNTQVRKQYGYLGGMVGLLSNIALFTIKLILGIIMNSISLIADSFNNLSDVGSSAITLLSFKLSNKPPDKEHPFGHGRTEYISALIISFIIILVGFELIESSFQRIINPSRVSFHWTGIGILTLTIAIKLWMSFFHRKLGILIDSKSLTATAVDSLSDVFATSCVILSIVLSPFLSFPIDAYIGLIVAGVIMYSGFSMAKETLNPLLGQAPDPKLVERIEKTVLHFDGIEGIHDLVIHDYGPGRTMATLHAEVSATLSPMVAHEIIDEAERKIADDLNIFLVIHTDPLNINCESTNEFRKKIKDILSIYPPVISFHDFRIVEDLGKNSMIFDVVVEEHLKDAQILSLKEKIKGNLKSNFPEYEFIIFMERQHAFFH